MSGIWYATAILLGRIFAIAAATGALFSIASEIGPLAPSNTGQQASSAQTQSSPANVVHSTDEAASPVHPAYQQAMELANQAVAAYQSAKQASDPAAKISFTQRERSIWQATLQKLASVPADAAIYEQAAEKRSHYQTLLATANSKLTATDNAFLKEIMDSAGVAPEQAHITLCQINDGQFNSIQTKQAAPHSHINNCRHHQGDLLLASAASLVKLPIAIALMDKVEQENLSLDDKIYIDPTNFTENAEGASIDIDQEYTLAQVATRMINESNNIATNQLIDYVGRDAIAKTMAERGYTHTLVDFKLAGDRILPPNPGTQSNQITSDDLTAMMVEIYSLKNPGDEELLKALISQRDKELGYAALQDLWPAVTWLGEKTGQNDRLIGSTLAIKIGDERYALTVAIDNSGDLHGLQAIIHGIAEHLIETGPLVSGN
ncbi:MAG: serine hydrolase [Phormidesmis sp.]